MSAVVSSSELTGVMSNCHFGRQHAAFRLRNGLGTDPIFPCSFLEGRAKAQEEV